MMPPSRPGIFIALGAGADRLGPGAIADDSLARVEYAPRNAQAYRSPMLRRTRQAGHRQIRSRCSSNSRALPAWRNSRAWSRIIGRLDQRIGAKAAPALIAVGPTALPSASSTRKDQRLNLRLGQIVHLRRPDMGKVDEGIVDVAISRLALERDRPLAIRPSIDRYPVVGAIVADVMMIAPQRSHG